jgi:hypothetical protein
MGLEVVYQILLLEAGGDYQVVFKIVAEEVWILGIIHRKQVIKQSPLFPICASCGGNSSINRSTRLNLLISI